MKNKSLVILQFYCNLTRGLGVNIDDALKKHGISLTTFYRYMETVREFLKKDGGLSVVYDLKNKTYSLSNKSLSVDID